jgi:phosphoglycolate phosphatase-like HAD superfamily hydrolase
MPRSPRHDEPRPPLEAVVFDVDGTLVDSERHGHRVAFNEAFAALGRSDHWGETQYGDLLRIAGGRQRLTAHLVGTGLSTAEAESLADRLHRIKTARFRDRAAAGEIPLLPGVARLVAGLQRRGIRLFVATTGSPEWVEPLLDHHFGLSTFERVVTAADVDRLKPDPGAYLEVVGAARLDAYAVVVSGVAAPMPHGLVTVETLEAVVGTRPRRPAPPPPKRWARSPRGRHRDGR